MDLTRQARRTLWICAALSAVTLAVYWPVTGHDFISCDDPAYVVLNDHVLTGLTLDNLAWAFSTSFQANWHPVTWLSHMLDVQLFGVRPGWHHLVSLLFLLLQRLTGAAWRSAVVAALFASNPITRPPATTWPSVARSWAG